MKHYILMCDIISSSEKSQNKLMNNFKACTQYINKKYIKEIVSPLTITLGDEFQALISNLQYATLIITDLEEFIIEQNFDFKLRYVLMYGEIETKINNNIAFEMLGKGLTQARKTLNQLKNDEERFYIDVENTAINNILNNLFHLYKNIVDKWKPEKDHQLISSFIKNRDYKLVSEELNKNRSLMWKREKTLNISAYFAVKEILHTVTNFKCHESML